MITALCPSEGAAYPQQSGFFDSGPVMPNNRMLEHYLLVSYNTPIKPFSQGPLPSRLRQWIALQLIPRHEYPVRLTGWRQVYQRAWSATLSFSLRQRRQRVLSIVRVAGRMGWRDTSNITTGGRFLLLLSHQGQIPIKGSK